MLSHCHDLGNNGIIRPLDTEYLSQLLKILR